ncbi:ABC transporter permease [Rhodovulum sp. NI22]|nr:ABC transporter permease [Rhodovulum sp. NI22]
MDFQIAAILFQDGVLTGAVYTMLALGFVLVFTTTRIIFASYGDLIAFSALTLHALQKGALPGTVYLLMVLAVLATVLEVVSALKQGTARRIPGILVIWLVLPILPATAALMVGGMILPAWLSLVLTIALVVPIAPLLYRIIFQPIETASTLTLLIVAVVLHYAIAGLALLFFGPEGIRTAPLFRGTWDLLGFQMQAQLVVVVVTAIILAAALAVFFSKTMTGKALRATAYNRDGARLVGISTRASGSVAFALAGIIAAIVGILVSSNITVYYDSGLMIGLKGFVGAVVGGFISYPVAAVGSLVVGLVESYASFFSSEYKEVIVFLSIIPVVLFRWLGARHEPEKEEEEETA